MLHGPRRVSAGLVKWITTDAAAIRLTHKHQMKQFLDCLAIIVLVCAAVFILAGLVILVIRYCPDSLTLIIGLAGIVIVDWAIQRIFKYIYIRRIQSKKKGKK